MSDLTIYRAQAGDLEAEHGGMVATLAELSTFVVASDDDSAFAADLIREVKAKYRELDDRRKEVTQPLNATVKTINGWFKPALDSLDAVERKLKAAVALFVQERATMQRAALAAAAAAQTAQEATAALVAVPAAPAMPAGMSTRLLWRWRVVNAAAVPREFCSPDSRRIDDELRGALADDGAPPTIAGVEFFQETSVAVRR